ncbi:MAG: hypothetical protein ACJA0S_000172 [Rickettsiales bacterium]|jgi:hypothetical protein
MHLLSNKIQKSALILLLIAICSCESMSERPNKNFLNKYQKDVSRINSQRNDPAMMDPSGFDPNRNWKESIEILNFYESTETVRTARIDTSKIKLPKPPEDVFPSMDTFLKGRTKDLPEGMFGVSYNPYNFPHSYGSPKLSFDDIAIPSRNAFGIETALGEKEYQLINHKTLQRDIDLMKRNRDAEDAQISSDLILEEKQAKRREYLGIKNANNPKEEDLPQEDGQSEIGLEVKNAAKKTISKTIIKTKVIQKIKTRMSQDANKELAEDEGENLLKKYQEEAKKMAEELNKELSKEANKNLTEQEKRELTEKEIARMMIEINNIISKDIVKNTIKEDSSR